MKESILICDDDMNILDVLRSYFEKDKFDKNIEINMKVMLIQSNIIRHDNLSISLKYAD